MKPGDHIYCEAYDQKSILKDTISKIGRKYVYTITGRKIDKGTLSTAPGTSCYGRIQYYVDTTEIEKKCQAKIMYLEMRKFFLNEIYNKLTYLQIHELYTAFKRIVKE